MKSMTGYGVAEGKVGKGIVFVEIRSVNNRFLDINCKLPYRMNPVESKIKKTIQNSTIRGKVDVFVKEKKEIEDSFVLQLNLDLAKQYKKCIEELEKAVGIKTSSHLLEIVDLKELIVFREKHIAFDGLWREIEAVVKKAVSNFDAMRKMEGLALKRDQAGRLKALEKIVSSIGKKIVGGLAEYRGRMCKRMRSISPTADENMIDNELAVVSEKADTTEEITRLKSHIAQYKSLINRSGAVGRQIDFLIQEMHREINTLGSKAGDSAISKLVVEAKSEIEKLREQVQNVE